MHTELFTLWVISEISQNLCEKESGLTLTLLPTLSKIEIGANPNLWTPSLIISHLYNDTTGDYFW